jgi:hypothetical protein
MKARSLACCLWLLSACGDGVESLTITLDPNGATHTVGFPKRARLEVETSTAGGLVDLEIDCKPKLDDADTVGFTFVVTAPALGLDGKQRGHAGYLRRVARTEAGKLAFSLDADGGPSSCTLRLQPASACGPLVLSRSVEVGHTHVATSSTPSAWEPLPVSGDHYPMWAPWGQSYSVPVRTGYLLHDLEHGGIVLSYRCATTVGDAACMSAQTEMAQLRSAFASRRVLDTPDPGQPLLYAARAWRWGLQLECLDRAEINAFMARYFRHGREDIDGDYGTPFDPSK